MNKLLETCLYLLLSPLLTDPFGWHCTKHSSAQQDTVWQYHSDAWGVNLRIHLYSLLAWFLKLTWHSALHPEEQEIKLRSTFVCWADLLPPHCCLIIQELWNVLLYASMQSVCLYAPYDSSFTELPLMHKIVQVCVCTALMAKTCLC